MFSVFSTEYNIAIKISYYSWHLSLSTDYFSKKLDSDWG